MVGQTCAIWTIYSEMIFNVADNTHVTAIEFRQASSYGFQRLLRSRGEDTSGHRPRETAPKTPPPRHRPRETAPEEQPCRYNLVAPSIVLFTQYLSGTTT